MELKKDEIQFVLTLIKSASFRGEAIDYVAALQQKLRNALEPKDDQSNKLT